MSLTESFHPLHNFFQGLSSSHALLPVGGWLELEEMLNNIDEEISTSREAEIV
jgi:hypothetical protein